jgi:LysM repeat protein
MNKKNYGLILLLSILSLAKNFAQDDNVFNLVFDESTMKKYVYVAEDKFPGKAFLDFRLAVSDKKSIILRVINNERYFEELSRLESEALSGKDPMLSDSVFIKNINSSVSRLNIIIFNKDKNNYKLLPVKKIILLEEDETEFSYQDEFSIKFLKNNLKQGANIDSSGGRILFKGKNKVECLNQVHFRIFSKKELRFHEDYFFTAQIGLTKIINGEAAMELTSINEIPLKTYLKSICNKTDTALIQKQTGNTDSLKRDSVLVNSNISSDSLDKDGFYTVKKEDNLYKIAKKFNTKIDVLMAVNNLNSDKLELGQKLKINDNQTYKDNNPFTKTDSETGQECKMHKVRQGENLWKIAGLYKINAAKLKELNKLSSDNINIGQELIIEILEKK